MKSQLILGSTLVLGATAAAAAEQPNILLFVADDHGFEQSEPYGGTTVRTPNMARVASQGLVFDQAYVASPASGPSRGALLSGLMSARNGAISNHQSPIPSHQTMVRDLQAQGYEVVAFGKVAHNIRQANMCKFDQFDQAPDRDEIIKAVKKYLANRKSDKPLCLMVGDKRPHVPWNEEPTYEAEQMQIPSHLIDTPETREHWALYLTEISSMDEAIGEVDALFKKYVGGDDYLFAYTADHGAQWPFSKWNLYERGVRTPLIMRWPGHIKAGQRTNAIVSWIDLLPTFIDIAGGEPTEGIDGRSFAKVLTAPQSEHRTELYTTHTSDGTMNIYPMRAMRDSEFKYIRNLRPDCYHSNHSDIKRLHGAGEYWNSWDELAKTDKRAAEIIKHYYQRPAEELYNLKDDPFETNNLANDPKYQARLKQMSAKLDAWMESQGDEQILPNEPYLLTGPTPHEIELAKPTKKR